MSPSENETDDEQDKPDNAGLRPGRRPPVQKHPKRSVHPSPSCRSLIGVNIAAPHRAEDVPRYLPADERESLLRPALQ